MTIFKDIKIMLEMINIPVIDNKLMLLINNHISTLKMNGLNIDNIDKETVRSDWEISDELYNRAINYIYNSISIDLNYQNMSRVTYDVLMDIIINDMTAIKLTTSLGDENE